MAGRARAGSVVRALVIASALAAAGPAVASAEIGAPGVGDPFFPLGGNGGYDVDRYDLRLAYDPATRVLDGRARITATATGRLERFDLDLRGFAVSRVTVDGRAAAFARDGQELVVTPARPVTGTMAIEVGYAGVPEVVTDPDGSIEGW